MNILLTGGAGYIGSHTAVALLEAGHHVVLYDNLSNSKRDIVLRLQQITRQSIQFVEGDIRDTLLLIKVIEEYDIGAVIHFAGLKAVAESCQYPVNYYTNNVQGTISLLQAMQKVYSGKGIKTLVFSSSATVYGVPQYLPIDENHPTEATNPYGRTKLHIEEMLADVTKSDPSWKIACLRYFNPVGAHGSTLISEDPNGIPNNLMPYMLQVAMGVRPYLNVYGNDYQTSDGTGIRDYIHVMDIAEGHLAALAFLNKQYSGFSTFNLGTGQGHSVLDVLKIFEFVSGEKISYKIKPRRFGDIAACYAKVDKAMDELSWRAHRNLEEACYSAWLAISAAKTLEY